MTEKKKRYSPEVKQRAVRMVYEHQSQYPSQWAAIGSIAGKFGCSARPCVTGCARPKETAAGVRA